MLEFTALARFQRGSPRRLRQVADMVRGKNALEALRIIEGVPRGGAPLLARLIRSARANAMKQDDEKKLGINADRLIISELQVNGGPTIKRMRPMSMGRSGRIRKRTAHVTVKLTDPLAGIANAARAERE